MFQQLGFRDDSFHVQHKIFEHAKFHPLEHDERAVAVNGFAADVEFESSERELRATVSLRAPDERLRARDELTHVERLRQVIVGAELKQVNDRVFVIDSGQDENGRAYVVGAKLPKHIGPMNLRQHQIEDDDVVAFGASEMQSGLAVFGDIDSKASDALQTGP